MKVELTEEARTQVQQIDAWWRENRQAAAGLFAGELEQALRALEATPSAGRAGGAARGSRAARSLLERAPGAITARRRADDRDERNRPPDPGSGQR